MAYIEPYRVRTITEFHRLRGLARPEHPLVSVINLEELPSSSGAEPESIVLDFYSISLKRCLNTKFRYGQQRYDFDEGVMFFISPGQVFGIQADPGQAARRSGWMLLVHPDFFWNTPLAKKIRQYDYFDYSVNEALFLSEKEEAIVVNLMQHIHQEYRSNIDKFSQNIIVSQMETLLNYSERFYQRQFLTRRISSDQVLVRVEEWLKEYFGSSDLMEKGLPSAQAIAASLNLSTNYLGSLLKALTGQSTQQHIHDKLIERAKERLSTTSLSVSEIAYELGFGHPQSFSKLFKNKTRQSPLAFRQSFSRG